MLIWTPDGYQEVDEKEARKLQDEDKCQIVDELNGANLKYAQEFTGYHNKAMATEVSAEKKPLADDSAKPAKTVKKTAKKKTVKKKAKAKTNKVVE